MKKLLSILGILVLMFMFTGCGGGGSDSGGSNITGGEGGGEYVWDGKLEEGDYGLKEIGIKCYIDPTAADRLMEGYANLDAYLNDKLTLVEPTGGSKEPNAVPFTDIVISSDPDFWEVSSDGTIVSAYLVPNNRIYFNIVNPRKFALFDSVVFQPAGHHIYKDYSKRSQTQMLVADYITMTSSSSFTYVYRTDLNPDRKALRENYLNTFGEDFINSGCSITIGFVLK